MKKYIIVAITLLALNSCVPKIDTTKAGRCRFLLYQRYDLINWSTSEVNRQLILQTDSLYIKSGCDTIK